MLRNHGVVHTRREGNNIYYSVAQPALLEILAVRRSNHDSRLERLTHWTVAAGGAIIGIAAAMFVLFNGRIAGISGILGGLLKPLRGDIGWRIAFIVGLVGAPLLNALLMELTKPRIDAGYGALAVAGLLVSERARYGSGCTSEHGVCGLSRFSPRSLVATATFMAAGFVTVFVLRDVVGA